MGQLSRDSRKALLDTLQSLPFTETDAGRNLLLSGLPADLRAIIPRSLSQAEDLYHIVDTTAAWRAPHPGDAPLLAVIDNARGLVEGSQAAQTLDTLRAQVARE